MLCGGMAYPGTKVIFTGRPNFFIDDAEKNLTLRTNESGAYAYTQLWELDSLTIDEVKRVADGFGNDLGTKIVDAITDNFSFFDIVSRPSMLPVVATIWKKIEEFRRKGHGFTSAVLLEHYIQATYDRKEEELRQDRFKRKTPEGTSYLLLPREVRELFTIVIVWRMAATGARNTIRRETFNDIVRQNYDEVLQLFVPDPAGGGSDNLRFPHGQFYEYFIAKAGWTILYRESSAVASLLARGASKSKVCDSMLSEPVSAQYLYEIVRDNVQPFRRNSITMLVLWSAMVDKLYGILPTGFESTLGLFVVKGGNAFATISDLVNNTGDVVDSEISEISGFGKRVRMLTSSAQYLYVLTFIAFLFYSKIYGIRFTVFFFTNGRGFAWDDSNLFEVGLFIAVSVLMVLNLAVGSASVFQGKMVATLRIMTIFKLYGLFLHEPQCRGVIVDIRSAIWNGCRWRRCFVDLILIRRIAGAEPGLNQSISEEERASGSHSPNRLTKSGFYMDPRSFVTCRSSGHP